MVKNDEWIIKTATEKRMIEPFEPGQVRDGVISYGVSSYGYDMRLSDIFMAPVFDGRSELDPKNRDSVRFEEVTTSCFALQPGCYVLGRSVEYFRIPRDVLTLCSGKSTYARCGVLINVTPFEPEWEGHVTISVANTAPVPVRLYAGEGIAQVVFLGAEKECRTSYADRQGKYQAQQGIERAKL
ncbi:MAG TPA: dCTP deaminase [bacterium]|nr:dCTP deaminase [bacterium]